MQFIQNKCKFINHITFYFSHLNENFTVWYWTALAVVCETLRSPAWRSPRALVSFYCLVRATLPSTDRRRDRKEGVKLAVEVTWPQLGRSLESSPSPSLPPTLSLPPSPRGINLPEFGLPPSPFPPSQITSKLRDSTQRERERGKEKKKGDSTGAA
ncbi:hypothetical protein CEXT_193641 [Caerostris extrusa]|uniref:Uncharacterized protein n=1 Tax=Caerostris extrusa TaxID=172846 RepID=A0AAV4XM28_CAEEX|nr:hypothetical protein CEXT_193641 [Caerostris extrusa]